jgi:threonine dehydrogenase-like Zn-dependent dehydrogenase
MLAAVIERPGAVAVREVPAPQAAGLALVRVGAAETLAQAIRLAGPAATVIMFGTVRTADGLPTYEGYLKELTIRCPRASRPRDFDTAIRLCAERRLDVTPLVTARCPLPDVARALAASEDPAQLKVVLDVAGR